jgi:NDP-sugar pyrophosphorylase family protein
MARSTITIEVGGHGKGATGADEMTKLTTLAILAAGIGRRYGGLKQLESVGPGGETLLEYSIFDALRAGFDRVVLVIRPETEDEFRSVLGARLVGVDLSYVHQTLSSPPAGRGRAAGRTKPWGTGHAVLAAEDAIHGPFAVINADDFYGSDSFAVLGEFLKTDHEGPPPVFALAGFAVGPSLSDAGPVSRGLCRADGGGWLEEIVEVPKLAKDGSGGRYTDAAGNEHVVPGDELVSMNMWGFTPAVFSELRTRFARFLDDPRGSVGESIEFLLPSAVQGMIDDASARVRVLRHRGTWCGITFPEDRERVRDFIAGSVHAGEYPARLWR